MNRSTSARSPLSPTLWPSDAFRPWPTVGFAALLAIASVVPATVVVLILVVARVIPPPTTHDQTLTPGLFVAQLVGYVIPVLLLLFVLPRLARRSLGALGLRFPRAGDLGWGVIGAIAMTLAADVVGALQSVALHLKTEEVQVQWLMHEHGPMLLAFVVLAVVLAPFFEELTFRGFLFNAILRYVPVAGAIVIAGLLFGLIHYQPGNLGAILPLAAGGMVLCGVYYRTGSLAASMIAHALFNAFTVVAVVGFHVSV